MSRGSSIWFFVACGALALLMAGAVAVLSASMADYDAQLTKIESDLTTLARFTTTGFSAADRRIEETARTSGVKIFPAWPNLELKLSPPSLPLTRIRRTGATVSLGILALTFLVCFVTIVKLRADLDVIRRETRAGRDH